MPRKLLDGSIETGKTPLQDGWALNGSPRLTNSFMTSAGIITWSGTALTFGADIQIHTSRLDNGQYIIHDIDTADSPIALADGEVIVVNVDQAATGNDTLVAGTYPGLAAGEYDIVANASLQQINAGRAGHMIIAYRTGSTLFLPLSKQRLNTGTSTNFGLVWPADGTNGQVLTSTGSGSLATMQDSTVFAATFGSGFDGDYDTASTGTIAGVINDGGTTFTLLRDAYFDDFTLATGDTLITDGYRLFIHGTLTLAGTGIIQNDGADGVTTVAGVGAGSGTMGGGNTGGTAGNDSPGGAGTTDGSGNFLGTQGATGGIGEAADSHAGGAGGALSLAPSSRPFSISSAQSWMDSRYDIDGASTNMKFRGGTGGGGGGGGNSAGERGGAGGGGGGSVAIFVRDIITTGWSGRISADGGAGGDSAVGGIGGGGGGGGGAGVCVIYYFTIDTPGNLVAGTEVTASGGVGGAPSGSGNTGGTATDGIELVVDVSA